HPHLKHAPKPHLGYGIISFFCVLAPEGMNSIVFGRDKGGEIRRLLLTRKMYCPEDYFFL
ncbi:MAG: hypothetical protein JTJ12_06505, partial [Eubacterium sp.]|nr:hypothetical protein [Eubacterium sp.]